MQVGRDDTTCGTMPASMNHAVPPPHVFTIGADHPSRSGHFPGQPLVPGVVLLEAAFAPLLAAGDARVTRVEAAKFLAPVHFDQEITVTFAADAADRISIDAAAAGAPVLRCRIRLGAVA